MSAESKSGIPPFVLTWLDDWAAYLESERDYFEREGEFDAAAAWARRAAQVRPFLAEEGGGRS